MNLGQAVALCLYELVRDSSTARQPEKREPATSDEVERISTLLIDALRVSGYPGPAASTAEKVRRLLRRLNLSAQDAHVWLGILRQINWKLRSGGKGQADQ